MNDLISRADAIEAVGEWMQKEFGFLDINRAERLIDAIEALPSAEAVSREDYHNLLTASDDIDRALREYQAKEEQQSAEAVQGWIPCSERLPSDDEYVIVSVLNDNGDTPWKYTTVAWRCNEAWISDNEILFGDVTAWMPLPTPYKGGDDECV